MHLQGFNQIMYDTHLAVLKICNYKIRIVFGSCFIPAVDIECSLLSTVSVDRFWSCLQFPVNNSLLNWLVDTS
jgi:hypothetical protein